jgi:hypothetical protein
MEQNLPWLQHFISPWLGLWLESAGLFGELHYHYLPGPTAHVIILTGKYHAL